MQTEANHWVYAAKKEDVNTAGCWSANVSGYTIVLFADGQKIYAVDNRCPHMGFPLERGTLKDGILTCHWHHARFDLASGGTFDQWADDVRAFPVEVRGGEVWLDLTPRANPRAHHQQRLEDGLERNISLVIAKAAIAMVDAGEDPAEPFRIGLEFGTRYRQSGWGQGLTMLTCFMNLLPHLDAADRPRALYHGLAAVARESSGMAPRFGVRPLPTTTTDLETLKRWFRQFVEVRDAEGAERCIVSAVRAGASAQQITDMLFAAATDHRYIQIGHVADFTNKALEALDLAGWDTERAEQVLTSLASGYANADRMEESNTWRNPVDIIAILEGAFEALPAALEAYRRGLEAEPGSPPLHQNLAALYVELDRPAEARAALAAIDTSRASPYAFLVRGDLELADGGVKKAIANYRKAASIDPKLVEPWLGIARAELARQRPGAARKAAKKALERDPANADARRFLDEIRS